MGFAELAERVAPVSLAGAKLLPLRAGLEQLFPDGALRRGSVVSVSGGHGATSLALAVLAGPSASGSWSAAVGITDLGLVAAQEAGIDLGRFAVVPAPGRDWPAVAAALLDAIDVVLVRAAKVRPGVAHRLTARARERGSTLVALGGWESADVRLTVASSAWAGLGDGHGHLRARRLDVEAGGRGAASRPRRVEVEVA